MLKKIWKRMKAFGERHDKVIYNTIVVLFVTYCGLDLLYAVLVCLGLIPPFLGVPQY